jgi:hypothetical protein
LSRRNRPFRALAGIHLVVKGVVQIHPGNIKQREGNEEDREREKLDLGAGEYHRGEDVSPDGRKI